MTRLGYVRSIPFLVPGFTWSYLRFIYLEVFYWLDVFMGGRFFWIEVFVSINFFFFPYFYVWIFISALSFCERFLFISLKVSCFFFLISGFYIFFLPPFVRIHCFCSLCIKFLFLFSGLPFLISQAFFFSFLCKVLHFFSSRHDSFSFPRFPQTCNNIPHSERILIFNRTVNFRSILFSIRILITK